MSKQVVLTECESIPVPPELQNLTAADRLEATNFGRFSEGDKPTLNRVTLQVTRAAESSGDDEAAT